MGFIPILGGSYRPIIGEDPCDTVIRLPQEIADILIEIAPYADGFEHSVQEDTTNST